MVALICISLVIVILRIFSCTCWPSVCILWGKKKSILFLYPFFNPFVCLILNCTHSLYNWILTLTRYIICIYPFPFSRWPLGFLGGLVGKESTCIAGNLGSIPGSDPWLRKIPWRRAWRPTPVFLLGESPWTEQPSRLHPTSIGCQSDMTDQLSIDVP